MTRRSDITATIFLFKGAENLKAFADVTFRTVVGDITIRRFKIIQAPSGKLWVAIPQFEFKNFFKSKYVDAVVLPKRTIRQMQRIVLKAYAVKLHQQDSRVQVDHS